MTKLQVQLFGKLGVNLGSDLELNFIEKEPTIRKVIKILIQKDPCLESLLLRGNDLRRGTILLINGLLLVVPYYFPLSMPIPVVYPFCPVASTLRFLPLLRLLRIGRRRAGCPDSGAFR